MFHIFSLPLIVLVYSLVYWSQDLCATFVHGKLMVNMSIFKQQLAYITAYLLPVC